MRDGPKNSNLFGFLDHLCAELMVFWVRKGKKLRRRLTPNSIVGDAEVRVIDQMQNVQAEQLDQIALRCSDVSRKNRPDLESEVLGLIQKMKESCQISPMGSRLEGDLIDSQCHPQYYICPINQDVMEDPHVAADGFTYDYEYDAIQGWLSSSHDTSPMTNLKLDHKRLVPNSALRSVILHFSSVQNCTH